MLCLNCKNEHFTPKVMDVPQAFRGEDFTVRSPVMACDACGWFTMTDDQADALCIITADAYREAHGLLTSSEIILRRTLLNMSQNTFAKFIDVGVASVKRWERGFVQEPIYDKRIRQKCDSSDFPFNVGLGKGLVSVQGSFSITTHLLNHLPKYEVYPIEILSIVSSFTNHVIGDAQLAECSKEWRKKHSFDTDIISFP